MSKDLLSKYLTVRSSEPTVQLNWLQREFPDPQDQREYARERAVIVVTEAIAEAMERAGLRRSDIAEILGRTKGHISRVMGGKRNMTLHTLSDILWACGEELRDVLAVPLGEISCTTDAAREWFVATSAMAEMESVEVEIAAPSSRSARTGAWPIVLQGNRVVVDLSESEINAELATAA